MKLLSCLLAVGLLSSAHAQARDWDGIPVPANAPSGKTWQLQSVSDDFNYTAAPTNKPSAFTNRWKDSFINPWLGPGLTEYNSGHSYTTGGSLGIAMNRKPGTNKVFTGVISSKQTFSYPLYIEASAKISDMVLANAVWMLSPDSTQEIDVIEAYGSSRPGEEWFAHRMHLAHHVFIREPFQDYQPKDLAAWYPKATPWRGEFNRVGVYWRDPWHLEYYINGNLVRTVSGPNMIDPEGFTNGTGLNKAQHIIIDAEDQDWRSDAGIVATDAELNDDNKSTFFVDWIRVYKAVDGNGGGGNNGGGNGGGGNNGGGSVTPPNGVTSLQVRSSNRCWDLAAGSAANGANIQQWGCSNSPNRDFRFVSKGGGYYEIRTKHDKCVSVAGNSNANGTNVQQWDCFNANNFQFKLVEKGGGWFEMRARHSNKCLDVAANSTSNGGSIHQWDCHGRNNQQFRFQ